MRAAPVEEHVSRRRWREHYDRLIERGERRHENRAGIRGLDLVMRIGGGREVQFRGRRYGVPPVPWDVAPRVLAVQQRWAALADDSPEWPALYREVARLFKLICFPTSKIRRWFWRLTPSPLRRASHLEVARALGFFSTFRRLDRGESPETILADLLPRGTSLSSSDGSAPASPRGATNGDSR